MRAAGHYCLALLASVLVVVALLSLLPAALLLGLAYVAWPFGQPWRTVAEAQSTEAEERFQASCRQLDAIVAGLQAKARERA